MILEAEDRKVNMSVERQKGYPGIGSMPAWNLARSDQLLIEKLFKLGDDYYY